MMRAQISQAGRVEKLEVLSGPQELSESAIKTVSQWLYAPATLNGAPSIVDRVITVNYALGG